MTVLGRLEEAKVVFDAWVVRVPWVRVLRWKVGPGRWGLGKPQEFPLVQRRPGFLAVRLPFTCYTLNAQKKVS